MNNIDRGFIDYKTELLRKAIHLFSLSIPIIYYHIPKELALVLLIPLVILSLLIDLGRYVSKPMAKIFYSWFGFLLRKHEMDSKKKNLSGASYVLISALVCALIFPKIIFVTAFAMLIIGDIAAALIGRRFGRHKFLAKSLEGTLAFFFFSIIVVLFTPKVTGNFNEYLFGFAAAAVGAIGENISYGWADDNLIVPLSAGFTLLALYHFFLPNLPLI